jgi:TPP-dependent pyruvate/acetoin dehydrogenase alpha subunit
MKKQTAVEWLQERYNDPLLKDNFISKAEFEQAIAMEKEQIVDAYKYGNQSDVYFKPEQYYNDTYGNQKESMGI